MITIIHGTDTASSRKYFLTEKEKNFDALLLDGEKILLTDLVQIFEGGGLFEDNKTIFIENIFNKRRSRKKGTEKTKTEFEILADYLQTQSTHNIFLWEGKELEKSSLNSFKTAIPRVFKLPQTLFIFLDNLKPGNKQLIPLFHQTIAATEVEMIFFMLVRQFRLFLALNNSNDPIDEVKRLAPWQKSKLSQQAAMFSEESLKKIYKRLFTLEVGQKTGTLASTLTVNIDFLLLEF